MVQYHVWSIKSNKTFTPLLCVITLMILLTGCDTSNQSLESDFSTYLTRIANVQQAERLANPKRLSQTLPDKRNIELTITPLTLGLLDSYELRKCQLFQLIAQRNSSLGRVQDEFRGFDYEIQLLNGIEHCLQINSLSESVSTQLKTMAELKGQDLHKHWYNLLYTSVAMRAQLTSHSWLADNIELSALTQALKTFTTVHDHIVLNQTLPDSVITPYQEVIEKQRILGALKFSLDNAALWLTVTTQQLQDNDSAIVCGPNQDRTRLHYLQNVFNRYYVERIQPALTRIDSVYLQLEEFFIIFEANDSMKSHFTVQDSHQQFRDALASHVGYWQQLFQRCSISVGR
ncbi:DUF3080 family protein [Vibrio metschnikovii]|uniref:DUF3080 family protein n=1 Tax=Vibrio metschnikovii TaxID=28172 RepID=UPI001C2F571A|nr:DUF3080 family protein [Vibrio metschnikovii]